MTESDYQNCAVKECQHPVMELYHWYTPEGSKKKWYCERHAKLIQDSTNNKRITP